MPNGWHSDVAILLRLLLAMGLAGIIGWDRESRGHSAGLRTNMLVGLSAALFTSTGDLLIRHFEAYGQSVRGDPIRILQSVVLGVSFLGSGIVFVSHKEDRVLGLTTAASIWTITGMGIVIGLGHYLLGAGVTLMVFVVLELVRQVEARLSTRSSSNS
jgi:putative Mg2+ transporter-C (MgtC) family protein